MKRRLFVPFLSISVIVSTVYLLNCLSLSTIVTFLSLPTVDSALELVERGSFLKLSESRIQWDVDEVHRIRSLTFFNRRLKKKDSWTSFKESWTLFLVYVDFHFFSVSPVFWQIYYKKLLFCEITFIMTILEIVSFTDFFNLGISMKMYFKTKNFRKD